MNPAGANVLSLLLFCDNKDRPDAIAAGVLHALIEAIALSSSHPAASQFVASPPCCILYPLATQADSGFPQRCAGIRGDIISGMVDKRRLRLAQEKSPTTSTSTGSKLEQYTTPI